MESEKTGRNAGKSRGGGTPTDETNLRWRAATEAAKEDEEECICIIKYPEC